MRLGDTDAADFRFQNSGTSLPGTPHLNVPYDGQREQVVSPVSQNHTAARTLASNPNQTQLENAITRPPIRIGALIENQMVNRRRCVITAIFVVPPTTAR